LIPHVINWEHFASTLDLQFARLRGRDGVPVVVVAFASVTALGKCGKVIELSGNQSVPTAPLLQLENTFWNGPPPLWMRLIIITSVRDFIQPRGKIVRYVHTQNAVTEALIRN
jgi:hypothetical protein